MSGSLSLDAPVASWLAGLDPTLSSLPGALPQATAGEEWLLDDVRWTPGTGCLLAYRVLRRGSPTTFVTVEVTAAGWSQYDYRDDAMLPGLAAAADPALAADLLCRLVGEPVRRCQIEPVRYRPGSRCVLRFDVETSSSTSTLYAKMFRPERFAQVSSTGTSLAAADPTGLVPEIAAVWPDLHVMLGRGVDGRRLSTVLGDPTVPAGQRARLAYRLGDLLARFHAQAGVTAPPWAAADQVAALEGSMVAVECADAHLGDRLRTSLDVLGGAVPAPGIDVLGHGAYRAGQVMLTGDDRLVVLDTDGACRCDPERDLGTVLAHLMWQGVRQPSQRRTLEGAQRALLSGYRSGSVELDPRSLLWWRAAGLLQVAVRRYRRLEVPAWPLVHVLADAVEGLLAAHRRKSTPANATDLLDTRQMSTVLRLALAPVATQPQTLEVESAEELATASGRRSVVRYTVRGLDGPEAVPVVGKVFAESRRADLLHHHLVALTTGPFSHGSLRVPQPVGLLAEERLVLYRPCAGVPLDRLTDPARALAGARGAGRWLARLHSSDVRLPRRFSLVEEAESSRAWAALIGRVHPSAARQARWVADRWVAVARFAAVDLEAPIHKDFHAGHVIVGDGIAVIDLDEARQGDPALDVAHFCTYLELTGHPVEAANALRDAFLDEYVARSAWVDQGSYASFGAYSWLKIAKQWTVGSGPCQGSPRQRPAGGLIAVEHALAKAEECLTV